MNAHHRAHSHRRTLAQPANCPLHSHTLTYIVRQGTHLHTQYTHNLTYTRTHGAHSHDDMNPHAPTWTHDVHTPSQTHKRTPTVIHNCHIYKLTHCHTHSFTHTLPTHSNWYHTPSHPSHPCDMHPSPLLPQGPTGHAHQSNLLIYTSSQFIAINTYS